LAGAVEALIASGHSGAWDYTPRQIVGFQEFAAKRRRLEIASDMSAMSLAMRGDPKVLKKEIEGLKK